MDVKNVNSGGNAMARGRAVKQEDKDNVEERMKIPSQHQNNINSARFARRHEQN